MLTMLGLSNSLLSSSLLLSNPYLDALSLYDNSFDFTDSANMVLDGSDNVSQVEDIQGNETIEQSTGVLQPHFNGSFLDFNAESLQDVGSLIHRLPNEIYITMQFNTTTTTGFTFLGQWYGASNQRSWMLYPSSGDLRLYTANGTAGSSVYTSLGNISAGTNYLVSIRIFGSTAFVKFSTSSSTIYDSSFSIASTRYNSPFVPAINEYNNTSTGVFSSKFLAISNYETDHSLHDLMLPFI